jgi:hypothetical protein
LKELNINKFQDYLDYSVKHELILLEENDENNSFKLKLPIPFTEDYMEIILDIQQNSYIETIKVLSTNLEDKSEQIKDLLSDIKQRNIEINKLNHKQKYSNRENEELKKTIECKDNTIEELQNAIKELQNIIEIPLNYRFTGDRLYSRYRIITEEGLKHISLTNSAILSAIVFKNNTIISNKQKYQSILVDIWKTLSKEQILHNSTYNFKLTKENGINGYYYNKDIELSFQSKDANGALTEIIRLIKEYKYTFYINIRLMDGDLYTLIGK